MTTLFAGGSGQVFSFSLSRPSACFGFPALQGGRVHQQARLPVSVHKAAFSRLCVPTTECKIKEIKKKIKSHDHVGKKTKKKLWHLKPFIDQITGDILQNLIMMMMQNYDRVPKHEKVAQAAANVLISLQPSSQFHKSPSKSKKTSQNDAVKSEGLHHLTRDL